MSQSDASNPVDIEHPVLLIDEVFQNILHFVHEDGENARSLVKCAYVCKRWSDAALPLLWRKQTSLSPILSLLGEMEGRNSIKIRGTVRVYLLFDIVALNMTI
jgi:hypothetical protein